MKISTKGRYALRMMLDIAAQQGDGFVTLKEIAARQEISKKYLEQIALQLTQAGLLHAARGHRGIHEQPPPDAHRVEAVFRIALARRRAGYVPQPRLDARRAQRFERGSI